MDTILLQPDLTLSRSLGPSVVAIGMFDGVHRGHQAVIAEARRVAKERGFRTVVFTFIGHPRKVLNPELVVPQLTTWEEKRDLLEQEGVETLVGAEFTPAFSQVTAEAFVREVLATALEAKHVVVGYNFCFGKGQEGKVETLRAMGPACGFGVSIVPAVMDDGESVSSSRIRQRLAEAQIEEADRLLGHPYTLTGEVVQGDQRGRLLGFPTANLTHEADKLLPAYGVYAGEARWGDRRNPCVVNLGVRPTFDGVQLRIEAHLLDFAGDLYGVRMTLRLTHRLRPERAFTAVEELVTQIRADVARAREVLGVPEARV